MIYTIHNNHYDEFEITVIIHELLTNNIKQYYLEIKYITQVIKLEGIVPCNNLNPNSPTRGTPKYVQIDIRSKIYR